jgi:threonine dehydrogenase-like Zn-dependent dehydrogenase
MIGGMHAWEVDGGVLRWSPVALPGPGANDTLIRVALAGVCGSDVAKLTKQVIPTPPGRPWRPGHEIVGWDLRSGSDEHLVAVNALVPCDACVRCRAGEINLCSSLRMVGWHLPGGFASHVVVPRKNAVALPSGLDGGTAILADPMAVAVHGIRCALGEAGGRLGVIGSGALATASAEFAASLGWRTVLLVRHPEKLAGIASVLESDVQPLSSVRPHEFDAVVDAAGGVDDTPIVAALDAVRDGGVIVVQTAYYPGVRLSRDLREPIRRSLTIIGSFAFCRRRGRDDFVDGLAFLASGAGWAEPFVAGRYALADLPRALVELRGPSKTRPAKAVLSG